MWDVCFSVCFCYIGNEKKPTGIKITEFHLFYRRCCVFHFDQGFTAAVQILVTPSQTQIGFLPQCEQITDLQATCRSEGTETLQEVPWKTGQWDKLNNLMTHTFHT